MPVLLARAVQSECELQLASFLGRSSFCSNLTFGTGGKNSDGVAVAGWGYYEASYTLPEVVLR